MDPDPNSFTLKEEAVIVTVETYKNVDIPTIFPVSLLPDIFRKMNV